MDVQQIPSVVDEGCVTFGTGGKSPFNVLSQVLVTLEVIRNWEYILSDIGAMGAEFIVLERDLFQQAVGVAIGYILPDALAHKCLYHLLTNADIGQTITRPTPHVETNPGGERSEKALRQR